VDFRNTSFNKLNFSSKTVKNKLDNFLSLIEKSNIKVEKQKDKINKLRSDLRFLYGNCHELLKADMLIAKKLRKEI
jgi:hypothetical protein